MIRITYTGIKEKERPFRVVNSLDFRKELDSLPEGRYRIHVEKWRKEKSLPQLGYYFACVLPLSHRLLLDAGWEFASLDEVDVFWKSKFANKEIVNRDTGEVMDVPALKREMTTTEFMTFIDSIRNYCSEYLNGFIPDPETSLEMQFK